MTSQEWTTRINLKQGFEWVQSEKAATIFGEQHEDNAQYVRRVLAAAVPDTGDAQVLGSEVSRVIDYPRG